MARVSRRRIGAGQRLERLEHTVGPDLSDVSEDDAIVLTAAYGVWWREWLGPMTPTQREAGLALLLEQATWSDAERAEWAKRMHLGSTESRESLGPAVRRA
jgi:hypothetical protein